MSIPTPGARASPYPSAAPRPHAPSLAATHAAASGFGESLFPAARFLLDVRWLALCLLLSLLPLWAAAQSAAQSGPPARRYAVGLQFTPAWTTDRDADQLLRNTDLSLRAALDDRWSLEATAGYWRRGGLRPVDGRNTDQGFTRFQVGLTLQREWRLRHPQWSLYAGAGLGLLYAEQDGIDEGRGVLRDARGLSLTAEAVLGARYRFKRAPLELDLGLRPRYGGRGYGLELRPSIGLRYRFGR